MKKKLKLNDVKVASFVTELNSASKNNLKGGGLPFSKDTCGSCLAYVSCYITDCIGDPM
ncbi:pinensin family lanthipeptide [Luteibaculum oceani]|uniref:pinensin family lanthipeptide n=1 Tax=Luteibaculum oceani TaxID=1294296 RepID=UPI001476B271|nr:pinensin family lanthipeptide [Luteibaculum oceani]